VVANTDEIHVPTTQGPAQITTLTTTHEVKNRREEEKAHPAIKQGMEELAVDSEGRAARDGGPEELELVRRVVAEA
jgi:hypothetical protein